jgi:hypothetical protein
MKKTTVLSVFISIVILAGCGTTHDPKSQNFRDVRPFKVKLEVQGDELINDRRPNDRCTKFDQDLKKGCFVAAEGEMLELEFKLKHQSDGKEWRFTKIMICAGTTKPRELSQCALNPDQRADWLVAANNEVALMPASGIVDLAKFADKLRVFSVRDFNWLVGDYVYSIQACEEGKTDENCDEDDDCPCVWMDPGGTNNGRNR